MSLRSRIVRETLNDGIQKCKLCDAVPYTDVKFYSSFVYCLSTLQYILLAVHPPVRVTYSLLSIGEHEARRLLYFSHVRRKSFVCVFFY